MEDHDDGGARSPAARERGQEREKGRGGADARFLKTNKNVGWAEVNVLKLSYVGLCSGRHT